MTDHQIQAIAEAVLAQLSPLASDTVSPIPIEASARHVHLTQEAVEALFGIGATLTQKRALSQPGEFLSEQRVKIVTAKGTLENVAVLGPPRKAVQAELSLTDTRTLGIKAPVNLSGDLVGAANVMLVGPEGFVEAKAAAIVAQSHIHMTPADAQAFGVQDGQAVRVRVQTARPVTFENVVVRVNEAFALAMHIDFDEANACALSNGDVGSLALSVERLTSEPRSQQVCSEKLITEAMAKKMSSPMVLKKGTIITPAANDIFMQKKITIEII
jgi:propanediol utilization protein